MENDCWDGIERRETVLADQRTRANGGTVEVPLVTVIIGFAAVVLLQLAALWGHAVLSDHVDGEAQRSRQVDASLTCYVVKVTQGQAAGPAILIDCGFLNAPGVKQGD